jgi:hypothetical protein
MKIELQYYFYFIFLFFSKCGAQCAMCRAALGGESIQAQAVNDGIVVYLMAVPYVLVAGIGYAVYRMRKIKKWLSNCFILVH